MAVCMKLKIEYISKEQLKPYAKNAKIHTPEQIQQIKNSIQQFGFNDPIALWHDNEVVEGHGRLLAVMEMDDIEKVPVIRLDELTDEQRRAYMIAHNKLTMNTDFDSDILGEEIKEMMENFDFTELGFGDFELAILTEDFDPEPYDEEEISDYTSNGDVGLAKKRVIITYNEEEEEHMRELLGLEEIKKVVYDIKELHK